MGHFEGRVGRLADWVQEGVALARVTSFALIPPPGQPGITPCYTDLHQQFCRSR